VLPLQGVVYPDSLLLHDVAVDMELTHTEGRVKNATTGKRSHSGGLTLVSVLHSVLREALDPGWLGDAPLHSVTLST
jgi:hypothetical protein